GGGKSARGRRRPTGGSRKPWATMTLSRPCTRSRPRHERRPPAARRYLQTANSGSAMKVTFCVRGVLSPLLANLLLDDLDKELEDRGHRFCRYADVCNIYVR